MVVACVHNELGQCQKNGIWAGKGVDLATAFSRGFAGKENLVNTVRVEKIPLSRGEGGIKLLKFCSPIWLWVKSIEPG